MGPWATRATRYQIGAMRYQSGIRMYASAGETSKLGSGEPGSVEKTERDRVIRHQLISDIIVSLKTVQAKGQQCQLIVQGDDRAQFCKESTRYSASAKLKHRLLTRLGYRVLHVPFYEWSKVKPRELATAYLQRLICRENFQQCGDLSEWLDLDDQVDWTRRRFDDEEQICRMVATRQQKRNGQGGLMAHSERNDRQEDDFNQIDHM